MKKILSFLLGVFLLCAVAGCSAESPAPDGANNPAPADSSVAPAESDPVDPSASTAEKQTAIVYFSCTGNTAAIAETMSEVLAAPVFEIVPAEPYTSDDLSYDNVGCRANREQNDDSARPSIAGDLSDIQGYATVYIGYPIWWGTNPKIIETFLDAYDLSGATVYTFCTSGSSGIETSVSHLQEQYPNVNIVSGHRFSADASAADIEDWLAALE